MNIQTVRTPSFTMEYVRFGSGEKHFVILPGLSVQSVLISAHAVAAAYKSFTQDYTVYLFDRRKNVPAGYTVHDMAQDTAAAMRTLGLEGMCLFGASQGGMIAMDIALEFPDLVQKLALVSTTARLTDERYQVIGNWADLARAGSAQDLYLAFGETIYPPGVFSQMRDTLVQMAGTVTAEEMDRFAILAEASKGFDVADALGKISCPVLVTGSRDDKVFGESASGELAQAIPGAELYMYDGYGHAVYDTAPDFAGRMLRFFQQT